MKSPNWIAWLAGAALLAGSMVFLSTLSGGIVMTSDAPPAQEKAGKHLAPDFELPDSSGKSHRLSEFGKNVLVLHFWASWCPPCLEEIGDWVQLARSYQDQPVRFVAVSLDKSWGDAQKILADSTVPANLISLLDITAKVPDAYGSYQFPETYLLGKGLEISKKWVGPQAWDSAPIRDLISKEISKL